jgi:dipeptidyl aminopeptidase/acylaminoacyl peptidase
MKKNIIIFILTLFVFSIGCQKSDYKEVKQYTIEQFMKTEQIAGFSISYDDKMVAYSGNKSGIFNIYSVPTTGGEPVQLTDSKDNSIFILSYFPKDNRILYSSDKGGNEIDHIFLREEDGKIKDLTPEQEAKAIFYDFSHDDNSILFQSNKRDPRFFDIYEMDIKTFEPKLIYKNDSGFNLSTISDDKRYLAFSKTITNDNSEMYIYDNESKELKYISPHTGDINFSPVTFSMDSKSLYFLSDEGSEFTYLKQYIIDSNKSVKTEESKWDITYAYFSKGGKYRLTGINNDGRTEIKIYDGKTGKPVDFPKIPDGDITGVNISNTEKTMGFYNANSKSPNNLYIYNFETGKSIRLTNTMNQEINGEELVETKVIRYKSFDGTEIPSLLYKPNQIKPDEKAPALIWVHGGPGGQSRVGYIPLIQYLVNHGYTVLAVNNRGSSGYGKTFYKMDDRKHGESDLDDCVEAKKYLISLGYVDKDKIGIIGGSYGGYMVLAGLAFRPDEFAIGVDLFGVANWLRTLKSIPPYWEAFKKALYTEMGDPEKDEEFLKRTSPLFHADKIKKPLIVLQGANDPRVIKPESDEIVEAVKKNGVPIQYVVFDDEGHGFLKKENEIKGYKAILDFLDTYLKPIKKAP